MSQWCFSIKDYCTMFLGLAIVSLLPPSEKAYVKQAAPSLIVGFAPPF